MHQCLKCKTYYEDDDVPIIGGCKCGGRMFLFVKQPEDVERAERIYSQLEGKIKELEQEQTSESQQELTTPPVEYEQQPSNKHAAVQKAVRTEKKKFGIETIKVRDIGIYEINLDALMKGRPVVVLSKGGSYIISLPSVFGKDSEVVLTT